jgi:hypothetical protein
MLLENPIQMLQGSYLPPSGPTLGQSSQLTVQSHIAPEVVQSINSAEWDCLEAKVKYLGLHANDTIIGCPWPESEHETHLDCEESLVQSSLLHLGHEPFSLLHR